MNFKFIPFILSILLISCDQCKDDPTPKNELEKLPAATREGKNTFGCLVDGKAWVTRTSTDARVFYQEGVLLITALNKGETVNQGMSIYVYDEKLLETEYHLSENIDQFSNIGNFGDNLANCAYETRTEYIGTVVISHLDQRYGEWIISGTFEFEAYSNECQKVVKVTDGRFDLNYAP